MLATFEALLPLFALIVLGNVLRRRDIVPEIHWVAVDQLCFWLFFPALLCLTMVRTDLAALPVGPLSLTMIAMSATMIAALLAARPWLAERFAVTGAEFTSIFQAATRWNGFLALAIALKLYGPAGAALVTLVMAVLVVPLNLVNIVVLAAYAPRLRPRPLQVAGMVVRNPLIWGALIGIVLSLAEVDIWEPAMSFLDLLGRAALGTGLLALGAGLRVRAALSPSPPLWLGVTGKLAVAPLLAAAIGLMAGLDGVAFEVALLSAAVPTAMNGYVLARQMGGDAGLYAATSTMQTALSFFTIPAVLALARLVSG